MAARDLKRHNRRSRRGRGYAKLVLRTVRAGLAASNAWPEFPAPSAAAAKMNAGGKFGDIGAVVTAVQVMDLAGTVFERTKDDLVFDYRRSNITSTFILGRDAELEEEDPQRIMAKTKEIWMFKRNSQPLNTKNAGCIFKNPRGLSAGALIDQAGLKGMRVGGAEISDKHANFIIAHPGCRAEDVFKLIKLTRERVYDKNQIQSGNRSADLGTEPPVIRGRACESHRPVRRSQRRA
jgi:UDP-N-acetylmuramate dehydrogenase